MKRVEGGMRYRILAVAAALAAAAACGARGDGPPAIEVDRTPCAHCGMLISEPSYAAAYQTTAGDSRVFDDIKCLLDAARRETDPGRLRFWFHDAATGAWIDRGEAVFVTSPTLRTPMGGGVVAYRDPAAAQKAAADHGGSVIGSFDALRKREGM